MTSRPHPGHENRLSVDQTPGRQDAKSEEAVRGEASPEDLGVLASWRFAFLTARRWAALLCATTVAMSPAAAWACTTVLVERGGELAVGKSYDWSMGQGLVLINKRGVAKRSLPLKPGDRPLQWVARHASVTFNQYGREMPVGGMNDAGLVVEAMWLESSRYPPADARPATSELQWIQYLLDTCASAQQVVEAAVKVRVSLVYGKIHYLACDRAGACVALEQIDGRTAITTGAGLKARTLTNSTYAESRRFLERHKGFGGAAAVPTGRSSLERFVRASSLATRPARGAISTASFAILDSVSLGDYSKWNIVYLPKELRVYFRTRANPRIKSVELRRVEGACSAPVKMLDIDADLEGDVTGKLVDYAAAANRKLLEQTLRPMLKQLPAGALELLAGYPARLPCTAK